MKRVGKQLAELLLNEIWHSFLTGIAAKNEELVHRWPIFVLSTQSLRCEQNTQERTIQFNVVFIMLSAETVSGKIAPKDAWNMTTVSM